MKNNFRIINFLRIVFKILYRVGVVGIVLLGIGHIVCLFDVDKVVKVTFLGTSHLQLASGYNLITGDSFTGLADLDVSLEYIRSSGLFYRILALLNWIIPAILSVFVFRYAHLIFKDLKERDKDSNYFSIEIYHRLKKIGFLILASKLYLFMNGAIISWFVLDNFTILDQDVNFQPDYTYLLGIVKVLVIFVFAEIYRTGISLKDEVDLTI
ncbi:DUF2975 family protein [Ancylomarina subtilis]|uniref:DUF2975 family protein n=1 Tax=Ancylomarina subtilis TaxID=1639035 RepID=A0A4Q7V981_9BACT|nr:DUF2975 domain-containing protein [Ancylomarina subtilis]RZT93311.1 DUF2975 family protein [Ancylomarina subtilis]